jgi:hypothetical protein
MAGSAEHSPGREERLSRLYLAVIERYRDYIEQHEHLSVAELPKLITPHSDLVKAKAEEIKLGFGVYSYNSSFLEASLKAFDFVNESVEEAVMPIEFWLTPDETMEFGIGDMLDRNTVLCSLLIALGNPSAKVMVYIRGATRKVSTYHEFGGRIYTMEFGKEVKEFAGRADLIASMAIDDETTAYEFDDKMYIEVD